MPVIAPSVPAAAGRGMLAATPDRYGWRFTFDLRGHMTEKEWRAELDTALAGGRPWRVTSAWCHRGAPTCGAELAHTGNGVARTVSLAIAKFPTPMARKAEIVRQLELERGH